MVTITITTNSVDETVNVACDLARRLARPAVLALSGRLGAGKTQFVKGLGMGLGLDPTKICSATFVLIAEYGEEPKLVHIDAYRFNRPQELENIGFGELMEEPDTLIAIEWADKVAPLLPPDHLRVDIDILDDHRRRITLSTASDSGPSAAVLRQLQK